jgi:hypothetical protein
MASLRDHVLAHPPRCLCNVVATSVALIEDRNCDAVAYQLTSKDGHTVAKVLGFPLRDFNPGYRGLEFVSPLYLSWDNGKKPVLVFDSDTHGYHGEMESAASYRGKGEPRAFECTDCKCNDFSVFSQFDYWDACNDLWEEEPDLPIENYFCKIMINGICTACHKTSRILDMDL